MHFRRLAKEHIHRQVDRLIAKMRVGKLDALLLRRLSDYRIRAAFALTESVEYIEVFGPNREHIALL